LTQYDRGKGWKAQTQHTDSRSHRRHFLHNSRSPSPRNPLLGKSKLMSITRQEALDHFHSPDLIGLAWRLTACAAVSIPKASSPTSSIVISTTRTSARSTALLRLLPPSQRPQAKEGYILEFEKIYEKIAETVEMGGHRRFDAGRHPSKI